MNNSQTRLTKMETFWYVLLNILTLGAPYFSKLVLKKALLETLAPAQGHYRLYTEATGGWKE